MSINREKLKMRVTKKTGFPKKYYTFGIVALLLLVFASVLIKFLLFDKKPVTQSSKVSTTSEQPSAQSDFTSSKERSANTTDKNEGTVTDNNGDIKSIPPSSEWSTSSDSLISVYYPQKNSILTNNSTISGETSKDVVSFRLIDDIYGMIAEGTIKVVDKKFSGNINFNTTGSEGRLDVYYSNSNGAESSAVEIPIRFK